MKTFYAITTFTTCASFIRSWIITVVMLFTSYTIVSQNADTGYLQYVKNSVEKLEVKYGVEIRDDQNLLAEKQLKYSDWRIDHASLELALTSILSPFNLTYFKESENTYVIRNYQYYNVSYHIGEQRLQRLSTQYSNRDEWEVRKENLLSCMQEALILDRAPDFSDSKPILTGKRFYQGYSVENIALEVIPGIYTTGSIYRPYPLQMKNALILTPHGHFPDGRYRDDQQLRSAMLAKMGAIVINYDLFAWGESELWFEKKDHRTAIAQTIQVLNGLRLLNYGYNLPEVNRKRIGITGASGGASHSLFLMALEERIKVSVPVVMISSYFSGGCPCETGQPVHLCGNGTNNAELAALAAPRPQLIISDGQDWTAHVPQISYPFIQRIYGFYDAEKQVKNIHLADEGHDFGISKREAMYGFMAAHLNLNMDAVTTAAGNIDESSVVIEAPETLQVFAKDKGAIPANVITSMDKIYELFGLTVKTHPE